MNVSRWKFRCGSAALCLALLVGAGPAQATNFSRGDTNADGTFDLSDGVNILNYLFGAAPATLSCLDAADVNDSGEVDLSDGSFIFNHLFLGGPPSAAPAFPACGEDPTDADGLGCDTYDPCPQDTEPPVISDLAITDVDQQSATISLDTDEPSTAILDHGEDETYGNRQTIDVAARSHRFTLDGLSPGTEYHFRVTAADAFGNTARTGDTIFSTAPEETALTGIGHLLNRITYGPTADAIERVETMGVRNFIEEQLNPQSFDESNNAALNACMNELFEDLRIHDDAQIVRPHDAWRYFKGTEEPPTAWNTPGFDDSSWLLGGTSIGYGDGDDLTVLRDMRRISDDPETPDIDEMQPGYVSVYLRHEFEITDVADVDQLIFRVDYDDSFVCYLNGSEIARAGLRGNPPAHNVTGDSHEAGDAVDIDVTDSKDLLVEGANVLAIQAHNTNYTSSDLTMLPSLIRRTPDVAPPRTVIRDIDALQELIHARGRHSRAQLRAVLAEFWENHFTTDYDKVAEHLDNLTNSDASDAMGEDQARSEAARLDHQEYEFFYENALGYWGDLLLYSATSVPQTVYLDNVLNVKAEPNENYAREILELYGFGVDNRYGQRDIEELSRCFTGWTICKVRPDDVPPFPLHSTNPPVGCSVNYEDFPISGTGTGLAGSWRYFKGTEEPSPDPEGEPTWDWARPDFDLDARDPDGDGPEPNPWLSGSTGADEAPGYEGGNDNPVLSDSIDLEDMRGSYVTVYLRKEVIISEADLESIENLILAVEEYDDGYVAYFNGVPVGQSLSIDDEQEEGPYYDNEAFDFDDESEEGHERTDGSDYWNLNHVLGLARPAPAINVLAFEVKNVSLGSSDLSIRARLVDRHIDPDSVENGDPTGAWTFMFNPEEHDVAAKTLFEGTPWQMDIPAGRTGIAGLRDALDVVEAMVDHPSPQEFICVKLIQKFVCDDISIQSVVRLREPGLSVEERNELVRPELRDLLARCIEAWETPSGPEDRSGHIGSVMRVILDPEDQADRFWQDLAYRSKIRTPIEYINASLRLLEVDTCGKDLPDHSDDMGMHLFTRDEPDGWDEAGISWADTAQFHQRVEFNRRLSKNEDDDFTWDTRGFLDRHGIATADEIVDFFATVMFHGTLSPANRNLLIEFVTTDEEGTPRPLVPGRAEYFRRVEDLVGLLLSSPQWHFQ